MPLSSEKKIWLWEKTANITLAILFTFFVILFSYDVIINKRIASVLMLLKAVLDVVFFIIRKNPIALSLSFFDWLVAITRTCVVFLFIPSGLSDNHFGHVVQLVGFTLQFLAALSLNQSWGIVPANRGIKTEGLYNYVRHPLYLAHIIAFTGFLMNNFSTHNSIIYGAFLCLIVLSIVREERFLLKSEDYKNFAERTKWRLMPGVY
ncbi:hypothetical protein BVY02_02690 [bacterium J17]|nr:hypothetical protein BVY02_02690 [bacterium J17]